MKQILYCLVLVLCVSSCKKYLDEIPDKRLNIPTTLDDFQQLLNQPEIVSNSTLGAGEVCADDYYFKDADYGSKLPVVRNCYTWQSDIWQGQVSLDWQFPYANIYRANVVMEGLNTFQVTNPADQETYNRLYGHALFLRAYSHYTLEEGFGQPYKPSSANTDLGIPLRLSSDLEAPISRATVQAVFDQILDDLEAAIPLLPPTTSPVNRPSKAAAFAMLARVYLTMQNYTKAGQAAESSLKINPFLYNYNNLNAAATNAFSTFTSSTHSDFPEILYASFLVNYDVFRPTSTQVNRTLLRLYDVNDLRKQVFFRKFPTGASATDTCFKAGYSAGTTSVFSGLATDEVYLIRAECFARSNNKDSALWYLNALVSKRWKNSVTYPDITATDPEDALRKIIIERRKELVTRGIRWSDLRRLNQDPRFADTLRRTVAGNTYTLPPNDNRYTFPIPDIEIQLSGIQQNPR